ncbi:mapk-related kinase [Stylonychia lemnae]|uniref:Mapk-related kinase n=1 Tax=Stylonychia lemnae TaxID=5949 RepID=A0A078AM72_STYLE|nr:mapk-related kinase [Stylonychia lemnae]|eukprot:CDW81928.1 mapk-related kinase [Stylonychia lemnae]
MTLFGHKTHRCGMLGLSTRLSLNWDKAAMEWWQRLSIYPPRKELQQRNFKMSLKMKKIARKCPYITRLLDIIEPRDINNFKDVYLVVEFMSADLKKIIKSDISLTEDHVKVIIYNILLGIRWLSLAKVLHRDIKPANILIDDDCHIRICDFGLARSYDSMRPDPNRYHEIIQKQINAQQSIILDDGIRPQTVDPLLKRKITSTILDNSKKERSSVKRKLSDHVVTRWYRPPEIILVEKEYSSEADIWGVGCIFAELLQRIQSQTQPANEVNRKTDALFPGKSCFPLSPDKNARRVNTRRNSGHPLNLNQQQSNGHYAKKSYPVTDQDQLKMIIDLLGTPGPDDISFITDDSALGYMQEYGINIKAVDLQKRFPQASSGAIDLLRQMIQFNPYLRANAEECIYHPYFDKIRVSEILDTIMPRVVQLQIDNDEVRLSIDEMKQIIIQEIEFFKLKRLQQGIKHIESIYVIPDSTI